MTQHVQYALLFSILPLDGLASSAALGDVPSLRIRSLPAGSTLIGRSWAAGVTAFGRSLGVFRGGNHGGEVPMPTEACPAVSVKRLKNNSFIRKIVSGRAMLQRQSPSCRTWSSQKTLPARTVTLSPKSCGVPLPQSRLASTTSRPSSMKSMACPWIPTTTYGAGVSISPRSSGKTSGIIPE